MHSKCKLSLNVVSDLRNESSICRHVGAGVDRRQRKQDVARSSSVRRRCWQNRRRKVDEEKCRQRILVVAVCQRGRVDSVDRIFQFDVQTGSCSTVPILWSSGNVERKKLKSQRKVVKKERNYTVNCIYLALWPFFSFYIKTNWIKILIWV